MKERSFKALGLMSGSSLDGLDLAVMEFRFAPEVEGAKALLHWQLLAAKTIAYTPEWQEDLRRAPQMSAPELLETDAILGHYFGSLVHDFLQEQEIRPDFIASHGHTVFHHPEKQFTTQIGSAAGIAAKNGITTIDNFRLADVAAGGQGAPIAPIADKYLFSEYEFCLNLGGIANLSCNAFGRYLAFDVGGANQILDALVKPAGMDFDQGGKMAARGEVNNALLSATDDLRYFRQPYPKSLDNEWVRKNQVEPYLAFSAPVENKLHTACRQLAREIGEHLKNVIERENFHKDHYRMLVTGGGAFNTFLLTCIKEAVAGNLKLEVVVPSEKIVSFKEAILMGLMGCLRILGRPNCMASVTGAARDTVGGIIHHA